MVLPNHRRAVTDWPALSDVALDEAKPLDLVDAED